MPVSPSASPHPMATAKQGRVAEPPARPVAPTVRPAPGKSLGEIVAGVALAAFGAAVALTAVRDYPLGSAARMGSGFMPALLGALLAVLGVVLAARAAVSGAGDRLDIGPAVRPLVAVLGAVLLFAVSVRTLGLVAAGAITVAVAACGSRGVRWREVLPLAAGVSLAAALLFVEVLGLPYRLWP